MKYVATFDIGSTAVKGALVNNKWDITHSGSREITTIYNDGHIEQSPVQWYDCFCELAKEFAIQVNPAEIAGVVMSGQMQNLIMLDRKSMPLHNAILYSDARADSQVKRINALLGDNTIVQVTGNPFDASIPLAKLLWIRENIPDIIEKTYKIVFSSKDTIISRLCGAFVTDVTTASTVGMMDITDNKWRNDLLESIGLKQNLLPRLCYAHEEVGRVSTIAAKETGLLKNTPVYAGTGDAGATTLAGCVSKPGEYYIYLGTSGWVATVSNEVLRYEGVFNLAAMPTGLFINSVLFLNAGNVHKWICSILTPNKGSDSQQSDIYKYGSELLKDSTPGSNGLFCFPYLVGERFPIVDNAIRGAYIGITPKTTKSDLVRAALEGVAYSIRQGIEHHSEIPISISLIGGGTREAVMCQLLSDVLGTPIAVYSDAEYAPSQAIAASVFISQRDIDNYDAFINMRKSECTMYYPACENISIYQETYRKYLSIYPALKAP